MNNDFYEVFNDCVNRLASGQTLEDCLHAYPAEAARLRPLLQTGLALRDLSFDPAQLSKDRAAVWAKIQAERAAMPSDISPRRVSPLLIVRLLIAAALLVLLLGATWFALTRLHLPVPPLIEQISQTYTATISPTPSAAPTSTPTATPTPSPTAAPTLAQAGSSDSLPTNRETAEDDEDDEDDSDNDDPDAAEGDR